MAAAVQVLLDWLALVLLRLVMVVRGLPLQYLGQLRLMRVAEVEVVLLAQLLVLVVLEAGALVRHLQIVLKVLALMALQILVVVRVVRQTIL